VPQKRTDEEEKFQRGSQQDDSTVVGGYSGKKLNPDECISTQRAVCLCAQGVVNQREPGVGKRRSRNYEKDPSEKKRESAGRGKTETWVFFEPHSAQ